MQRESEARPAAPDAQDACARATLDKLQAQLALLPTPAKLRKALSRLSALTLSADLLADSRLRKALRRLRDYQQLATLAAHLLDRWSPLPDAQAQAGPSKPSPSKHQGQKRSREARAGNAGNCSQPEPTAPRLDTRGAAGPAAQGPPRTVPPLRIRLSRLPSGPRAAGSPDDCPRGHADSESHTPARLTWEECLDYQLPPRKKKRTKGARAGQEPRSQPAQGTSGRDDWALESAHGPPPRPADRRPSTHDDPQLATALSDSLTWRPDPASPRGDAGEAPLPHWDWMSFGQPSPPRRQEPDLAPCRVNGKTCVFAGSQRAPAPAVPSLRQLCTRLLQNHPDAIGPLPPAAPYSLLEPVLRSCSPDQLYRIETCNPGLLVPHADKLWKAHCAQRFATDAPKPGETWRDAYLRLQLARERRLQALTLNFRSARLTKLQDARTKMMVFHGPPTKPVPRLNGPHGDPGEDPREETHARSAPAPTDCKRGPGSKPGTSLTPTGPHKATSARPYPGTAQRMQASGKRELQKPMAPLMAKSIKDCRRLVSRRY